MKLKTTERGSNGHAPASRAIAYLRVSSAKQQEGTSLDSQFLACRTKAEQLGARLVSVFEDTQSGADYRDRRGIQSALEALERDEADTLIVYDMSRYSRDVEHQQLIKKRVQSAGKKLVFATLDLGSEDTPESHLMFGINGQFAEYERFKIRQRTMLGTRTRAQEGRQPRTGMRPFGYEIVSKRAIMEGRFALEQWGTYQVIEAEASHVREIFARYAAGASLYQVTLYLKSASVPTTRGGRNWYPNTVREILQNPVYKGAAVFGRWKTFNDEMRLDKGLGKRFKRLAHESEQVSIPAPALVNTETWEQCQVRLRENRARLGGNPDRVYMLSGLLICPQCGHAMGGKKTSSKRGGETWSAVYICRHHSYAAGTGRERCSYGRMLPVTRTDEAILKLVVETASDEKRIASEYRPAPSIGPDGDEATMRRRLSEIGKRQDALIEAQTRAILQSISSERYEIKLAELERESQVLRGKLQELAAANVPESVINSQARAVAQMVKKLRRVLLAPTEQVSVQEKHRLLSTVIERITPTGSEDNGFKIAWKGIPAAPAASGRKKKRGTA